MVLCIFGILHKILLYYSLINSIFWTHIYLLEKGKMDFTSSATLVVPFVVLSEMSRKQLDELPWTFIPLRMSCNDFVNPITFHLAPSSSQIAN